MREIVLDTETTGLDPDAGDRVVEIGCVELVNGIHTNRSYHTYLNPEREITEAALQIHGLSNEFLADKPLFADVAEAFLDFIGEDRLVIHNAEFDLKFINAELVRVGRPPLERIRIVDTLEIARRKFPGERASLDALCRRFNIDNSGREKHGALLDAELLALVYGELMGGRQAGLEFGMAAVMPGVQRRERPFRPPRPHAPSAEELARHEALLARLVNPLWQR